MESSYDQQELMKAIRQGFLVPERSREYWNAEERGRLNNLYAAGIGISEIAMELQRSEMAVIQQLIMSNLLTTPGKERRRRQKRPHCLCEGCLLNGNCDLCRKEACYAGELG